MLARARRKRLSSSSSSSASASPTTDSSSSGSPSPRTRLNMGKLASPLCIQDVPIQENKNPVPRCSINATVESEPSTSATAVFMPSTNVDIDHQPHKNINTEPQPSTSIATAPLPTEDSSVELSEDLLKILDNYPSDFKAFGKEIQPDLAIRLQHLATCGLTKEARYELMTRYRTPSNCLLIDAPALNPEIKAAISEIVLKRDKGIEQKQKQLSSATSCIAEALTLLMAESTVNTTLIQILMDATKLLCDTQYADSLTRRNFVLSNLKKELKQQLQSTKIDKMLFSESLPDTLKAAKAISKSGADMKIETAKKQEKITPNNSQRMGCRM